MLDLNDEIKKMNTTSAEQTLDELEFQMQQLKQKIHFMTMMQLSSILKEAIDNGLLAKYKVATIELDIKNNAILNALYLSVDFRDANNNAISALSNSILANKNPQTIQLNKKLENILFKEPLNNNFLSLIMQENWHISLPLNESFQEELIKTVLNEEIFSSYCYGVMQNALPAKTAGAKKKI